MIYDLSDHAGASEALRRPRDFLDNRYVYAVISSRAKGLSVGVNINPTGHCSFDCLYCEVDHHIPLPESRVDLDVLGTELENTMRLLRSDAIKRHPFFGKLSADLQQVRHVAISGNGEPTLCRDFRKAVEAVLHVRAKSREFFKVVLITNSTGLDLPEVQAALDSFTTQDEVWAKLDAGSPAYVRLINRSTVPLEKILTNILRLARRRPITIQSLFSAVNGQEPPPGEIQQYALNLRHLREAGAQIKLVQIYSADRPCQKTGCSHLPLKTLSSIAKTVRETAGVSAEVF